MRNEKYTGLYIYCLNENKDRCKRRTKEGGIRIEGDIPQIIEKEHWEKVQSIMKSNKNLGKKAKRDYLLSGLVVCECGSKMHAQTTNKKGHTYSLYRCTNCKLAIKENEANEKVFSYIVSLLSPKSKEDLAVALTQYDLTTNSFAVTTDAAIKNQINEKHNKIDNLMNNMSIGTLSAELLSRIDENIAELKTQIELNRPKKLEDSLIKSYLDFISDVVLQKPQSQKMIINHLIKSVEITKTSVSVLCTFTEVLGKIGCGGRFTNLRPSGYEIDNICIIVSNNFNIYYILWFADFIDDNKSNKYTAFHPRCRHKIQDL